jgi:hypothetical protein
MLFKRQFTFTCRRPQDEVMGALRQACQCKEGERNRKITFTGRLHQFGFVLWRHIDRYNVFSPRVCGSFKPTPTDHVEVGLTMRLHRMHQWIMFITYLCWASSLVTLFAIGHHLELSWIVGLLPLPLLGLGIWAFRIDSRRRARKIMRAVKGQRLAIGQRP